MEKWYKLQDLRKKQNLTQERLAKKLGISVNSIKNYERDINGRIPDYKALEQYHIFFNVSYDYLLDDNVTNKTAENIQIEKILKLSDKAISNLKNCNHSMINLLLESDKLEEINNLLGLYIKFSYLEEKFKQIEQMQVNSKNINISFASKISKIMEIYDNCVQENNAIIPYTSSIENIEGLYSHILSDNEEERDTHINVQENELDEDLRDEYNIVQNTINGALKTVKFELVEAFSKFLTTITN